MTEQGTLIAGRYRLERKVGSGAMGVVWQSVDERLGRTVAVKQLLLQPGLDPTERDEAVERTLREGRIAARLHHTNAISVFDVVDNDGIPCLVMEYLPSRSLDDVMRERGSIPPEDVATIGGQVASALAAAHEVGIVHRDIKPGNVLLGQGGQVKITDFGISRATDDITVTKTGLIAGTPAYLAPEVAVGREPEHASDVFSLGSTLYAAVEGTPPFGLSDNTLSLLHVVARGQINPPQQAGPLAEVLQALLRADPAARPSAREAAGMLRAVAQGRQPEVPPEPGGGTAVLGGAPAATRAMTSTMPRTQTGVEPAAEQEQAGPPRRKSRRGLLLAVLALLVLAGIVLGLWASGAFDNNDRRPHAPVPSSPTSVTHTQHTTTEEEPTTEEETGPPPTTNEPTTTQQQAPPPTTTSEPPPSTTTEQTTQTGESPTQPSRQGGLPPTGGDGDGQGGGANDDTGSGGR